MFKIIPASILIFSISGLFAENDIVRFNRSIREFTYQEYKIKDTDGSLQMNFNRQLNSVDQSSFDLGDKNLITKYSTDEFSGLVAVDNSYTKIKPDFSLIYNDHYTITGNIREICRSVDDTLTSYYKENSERTMNARGEIKNELNINRHFYKQPLKNLPYIGASIEHRLIGDYDRKDNYVSNALEYEIRNNRNESISDNVKIIPKAGLNNRKPVNAVFKAFNLESKLRTAGIIRKNLSDGTLKNLSTLIAAETKYQQSYEYYTKFLMDDIDSLLRMDSAIDTAKLNAFVLFKAHEALTYNSPDFHSGFEVYATYYCNIRYSYWKEYVYKSSSTFHEFYFDVGNLEFNLRYTHPLFSKLYINTEWTVIPYGASDDQFKFRYQNVRYLFGLFYLLSDRVFVNASLSNKPQITQIGTDFALSLSCFTKIYIDEKLSLYLTLQRYYDRKTLDNYLETNNYSCGNIGVTYDF